LPSLVICPATLCNHWYFETLRFVGEANVLSPIVYSGPVALRADLRRRLSRHNLVITSYEVIRNDIEHFSERFWNYLVLDEGHLIKNAKAKTTLAIKSLKAQHRLILSGTPIQNSVLDLWSLFDFLMPGFLGSEKEFGVKYGKPIVSSRDPRSSSKEQEAGALALEALHKQVLPFILRRMKEDVLKDLPPKIVQDFHCELSPLQVQLYEDFSQSQLESARAKSTAAGAAEASSVDGNMKHIFQALQYLRKVCNHPKLVLSESHPQISQARELLASSHTSLSDISHAAKLPALRDLLLQCGIGSSAGSSGLEGDIVVQHRALVYFQFKAMMDIVESDLLKATMPGVTYLRLDGSVAANSRQAIVDRFNKDASIDLLLLSTSIGTDCILIFVASSED
jgi:TATA-binding protein-associated factor